MQIAFHVSTHWFIMCKYLKKPQTHCTTSKKNFGKLIETKPNAASTQHMSQLQQNPQTQEASINPDLFSDRIHLWSTAKIYRNY